MKKIEKQQKEPNRVIGGALSDIFSDYLEAIQPHIDDYEAWRNSTPFLQVWLTEFPDKQQSNFAESNPGSRPTIVRDLTAVKKAEDEANEWLDLVTQNYSDELENAIQTKYRDSPPSLSTFMLLLEFWKRDTRAEAARHAGEYAHKADADLRAWVCAEWDKNRSRYKSRAAAARHLYDALQHEKHEHYRAEPPTVRTLDGWMGDHDKEKRQT